MASEGVHLVTRIEEFFGVTLSDDEVQRLETLGQLSAFLTQRVTEVRNRPCVAAWIYYRFRRVLMAELPVPKRVVRPQVSLWRLIPGRYRKRVWRELQHEFSHHLPELQWPQANRYGLLAFAIVSLVLIVAGTVSAGALEYLFVLPFVWASICWIALMLGKLFAVQVPAEVETVAKFVAFLVPFKQVPTDLTPDALETWVFEQVRRITAETLAVDPATLDRDKHFIRDLGLE